MRHGKIVIWKHLVMFLWNVQQYTKHLPHTFFVLVWYEKEKSHKKGFLIFILLVDKQEKGESEKLVENNIRLSGTVCCRQRHNKGDKRRANDNKLCTRCALCSLRLYYFTRSSRGRFSRSPHHPGKMAFSCVCGQIDRYWPTRSPVRLTRPAGEMNPVKIHYDNRSSAAVTYFRVTHTCPSAGQKGG